jgi:hypothetical protein
MRSRTSSNRQKAAPGQSAAHEQSFLELLPLFATVFLQTRLLARVHKFLLFL